MDISYMYERVQFKLTSRSSYVIKYIDYLVDICALLYDTMVTILPHIPYFSLNRIKIPYSINVFLYRQC